MNPILLVAVVAIGLLLALLLIMVVNWAVRRQPSPLRLHGTVSHTRVPEPGDGETPPIAPHAFQPVDTGPGSEPAKVIGILVDATAGSRRLEIDGPTATIGRAPGNNLVLDFPTVSRHHATIRLEGHEFRVYDLGSSEGTFVNDQRVGDPVTLEDGVMVRFGEAGFVFKRVLLG